MKKIFYTLFLLLCTIFITSCNNVRVINAENCFDYFIYFIGKGQTVYVENNSIKYNTEFNNYLSDTSNKNYYIKAVISNSQNEIDDNILKIVGDYNYKLSITCLKPFEENIKIDKIIFIINDVQVDIKYNIELIYNTSYESLPPYPRSYSNNTNLGITMSDYSDLVVDRINKYFYIKFNPSLLKIERENNYTINGVEFNNSMIEILNVTYAIIPNNADTYDFFTYEYKDFSEKVDILDYTNGIILKIDFNISNENIQSIGCDLNFDISFNGDDFCIPYNVYYTPVIN